MFEILALLFDICLFKKGPQDLPYVKGLLRLLFIVNVVVSFLMVSLHTNWLNALLQAGVSALLIVGFCGLMLTVAKKTARFYQTACALLGIDAMISFFALPSMASIVIGMGAFFAFLLTVAMMVWHLAVIGHIIRNALGQTLIFSLGLAFLYILVSYQVMALFFPEVADVQ